MTYTTFEKAFNPGSIASVGGSSQLKPDDSPKRSSMQRHI
jgi:hypothetical protein